MARAAVIAMSTLVKKHFSVRLEDEQMTRLHAATDRAADPYAPTITRIVERGIELALAELERKAADQ